MNARTNKPTGVMKNKGVTQESMPRAAEMGRREFLKWLGLAGAVAVLGAGAGLRGISSALTAAASEDQASTETVALETAQVSAATSAPFQSTTAATESSTSTTCTVRCRNGCSYPGHCRRYVDSNGNNRCDYGECM